MTSHLDVVFLDVGGILYRDERYREALRRALRESGASFTDEEFAAEYEACRRAQSGSFRRRLTRRFLGEGGDPASVEARASRWWRYEPEDLYPDVRPTLEVLAASYRLGVLANQPAAVRQAMRRDGIDGHFESWSISEDVGAEKPDPRLFRHALELAGVPAHRAAMVGDRLDYDVRPARAAGMRAVWVLRGEAPEEPTPEQLAEADAWVRSLAELPEVLDRL